MTRGLTCPTGATFQQTTAISPAIFRILIKLSRITHTFILYPYLRAIAVIPLLSTENEQAMLYAEMLLIKIFGRASALQALVAHPVGWQQKFTPGTLTAARRQEFIRAFVTRNLQNVLNPMHLFQSWYKGTA